MVGTAEGLEIIGPSGLLVLWVIFSAAHAQFWCLLEVHVFCLLYSFSVMHRIIHLHTYMDIYKGIYK